MKKLTLSTKRDILFALFVSSMVIVNTLGTKITSIFSIRVSVGIFFMPLLFLITDVVGEVCGHDDARRFVTISVGIEIFLFFMTILCVNLKPDKGYIYQREYSIIFNSTLRMTLASLVSFTLSQSLDVWLFEKIRQLTKGRKLWIRNNAATIISQFADTLIFDFIAFWRISETFTVQYIFSMVIPYWLFKVIFALLDTPFCYIGVLWLKNSPDYDSDYKDLSDTDISN